MKISVFYHHVRMAAKEQGVTLPEMMQLDETTMLNFLGIAAEDCTQVIAAICTDGMKTDEVWLVEAKDAAALERVKALAETRLKAKTEETISYAPDQYAIVEKAELLTQGNYLALIVTAEAAALASVWEGAVK